MAPSQLSRKIIKVLDKYEMATTFLSYHYTTATQNMGMNKCQGNKITCSNFR